MAKSYFLWNGVDSRTKGIYLSGPAPRVWPEERISHIEIPGRAGDLTQLQGEDIYNSYIQTLTIHVKGAANVRTVQLWLRGSGKVAFSTQPDRMQAARVIGAVTLNKHSRNLDLYVGEVQFYCQPFKERLVDTAATVNFGHTVNNEGDVRCYPKYTVTPTSETLILSNSRTVGQELIVERLEVDGVMVGRAIVIDSENKTITDTVTGESLTDIASGVFPTLAPGTTTVGGGGWSSVSIVRRERWL